MIQPGRHAEEEAARKTGLAFALMWGLAPVLGWYVFERRYIANGRLDWFRVAYLAYCLGMALVSQRLRWGTLFERLFPVLLMLPSFALSWYVHRLLILSGLHFVPFLTYKLAVTALSLAPGFEIGINVSLIVVYTVEAFLLWYVGGARESLHEVLTGEPWATLIFAFLGCQLAVFQRAHRRLQRELGEIRAKLRVYEDLASVVLLIRDKINTPLQTLQTSLRLMEKSGSAAPAKISRARASLDKIAEVNSAIRDIERYIVWEKGGTLDEKAAMKRLIEDLQQSEVHFRLRA